MIILRQREFGNKANKAAKREFEFKKGIQAMKEAFKRHNPGKELPDHLKNSEYKPKNHGNAAVVLEYGRRYKHIPGKDSWYNDFPKHRSENLFDKESLANESPGVNIKYGVKVPFSSPIQVSNDARKGLLTQDGIKPQNIHQLINMKSEASGGRSNMSGRFMIDDKVVNKSKILKNKKIRKIYDHGKFQDNVKIGKEHGNSSIQGLVPKSETKPKLNNTESKPIQKDEFNPIVEPVERPRIEGRRRGIM